MYLQNTENCLTNLVYTVYRYQVWFDWVEIISYHHVGTLTFPYCSIAMKYRGTYNTISDPCSDKQ